MSSRACCWFCFAYSCLENPMDGGAWWAAVHGVAKIRIWLSNFIFTFHFPALEKEMATHSSVPAWRIPGTGEPGGLLSLGLHRVGHDWSDLAAAAAASSVYAHLLEGFFHKWGLNFAKAFSASVVIIIWVLFFSLLIWCITLIDLWISKNPCISGTNPTQSWCMIFLMCCWILFASLLRILCLCWSVILAHNFLPFIFWWYLWFWY